MWKIRSLRCTRVGHRAIRAARSIVWWNRSSFVPWRAIFGKRRAALPTAITDIDEHTIVVLNGDRASWIRKGVDYFPNVLYQFDRWHLRRDLRRLFAKQDKVRNRLLAALDADDATGATFIAAFAEALKVLDGEKRKEAERLLKDLASMPEAIV